MNIPIPKTKGGTALIIVDVQPVFLNKDNKYILDDIYNLINGTSYDLYVNAVFYADKKSIWQKQTEWNVPKKEARTHNKIKKL